MIKEKLHQLTEDKHIKFSSKKNECLVSKASIEIMLDRVCNGSRAGFPFC